MVLTPAVSGLGGTCYNMHPVSVRDFDRRREYMRLSIQHEVQVDFQSTWFFLYIRQGLLPILRVIPEQQQPQITTARFRAQCETKNVYYESGQRPVNQVGEGNKSDCPRSQRMFLEKRRIRKRVIKNSIFLNSYSLLLSFSRIEHVQYQLFLVCFCLIVLCDRHPTLKSNFNRILASL